MLFSKQMPQEPSRDSWVERYENDVYKRFSETAKLGACRPPSLSGIIQCDRPIERGGRCVLHTPKLTEAERRLLEPFDLTMEQSLEHRFLEALRSERGIADFSSIHFPALQWNQSPLRELLTRQGSVNFNMAVFHQKADFSGIHFSSRPSFMRTVFRDAVTFTSASFASGAIFSESVFKNPATFEGCLFENETVFGGARFLDDAIFKHAKVEGKLRFMGRDENAMFHSASDFSRLEIGDDAFMIFELVSLAKASFLYSDLTQLDFRTVSWCEASSPWARCGRGRLMLWDEMNLLAENPSSRDCDAVGENYRQLVLRYEARRDFERAEQFHIGEMEVQRKLESLNNIGVASRIGFVSATGFYRLLSRYGSSYWRAALVLFCVLTLVAVGFMFTGLRPASAQSDLRALRYEFVPCLCFPSLGDLTRDFGTSVSHALNILTFQRDRAYEPSSLISQIWQAFSSILLTGQSALVLLAIRRRFRRG